MNEIKEIEDSDYGKMMLLLGETVVLGYFKYQELICRGDNVDVVRKYIIEKPSKKFRIWLIDNNYVVDGIAGPYK